MAEELRQRQLEFNALSLFKSRFAFRVKLAMDDWRDATTFGENWDAF